MAHSSNPCVLIVGNFLSDSIGSRSVCEDLAVRLAGSGWPVLTTSSMPSRIPRLVDMISTVWHERRNYAVAQIDVYSGLAFIWAEIVCLELRTLGTPYILSLHGGNLPSFARRWPRRVRKLLRSAALVTTPSQYLREQMLPCCEDLVLLPNPLDLKNYRMRLRQRPKPNLVWLRAFHRIYNPVLAINVLALLVQEFPEVHLTMVGPEKDDGCLDHVKRLACELGVSGRLSFPGTVSKAEVSTWLHRGDVFLNTANVDNTPVSVMEAMASGLCLVSTDVGGIPYLLQHEHDALLIPPDDPEGMAAAVRRFLTEPGLARKLSRNARAKAEEFHWGNVLPQWQALLSQVVGNSKG